jgi:hypothetical protein
MPAKKTFARVRIAMPSLNGSSALRIMTASLPSASASMPFSSAIASREPMNSMCAIPMFVMMPASGAAIAASTAISPGWFIPSSHTAISCCEFASRIVRGRPTWLLKLPSVFVTWKRRLNAARRNPLCSFCRCCR